MVPTSSANQSLSGEVQAFLERINPYLRERRGNLAGLLERIRSRSPALPGREEARRFFEIFAESNECVRREWFPERDRLFNVDFEQLPEQPVSAEITLEEAFSLFAYLWQQKQEQVEKLSQELDRLRKNRASDRST